MIKTIDGMNFNGLPQTIGAIASGGLSWLVMTSNIDGVLQTVTLAVSAAAAMFFAVKVVFEVLIARLKFKKAQAEQKERDKP